MSDWKILQRGRNYPHRRAVAAPQEEVGLRFQQGIEVHGSKNGNDPAGVAAATRGAGTARTGADVSETHFMILRGANWYASTTAWKRAEKSVAADSVLDSRSAVIA